jgi:catechol 2,3-dioxygenase-like lactoylglutathione lyase family enzyme
VIHSLDHVIVGVRDLESATETYTRLLGREPSWRGSHPGQGTANTLFRVANGYLELLGIVGEGAFAERLRGKLERDGEGVAGFAFGVDDADECARELRARGLPATDPIEGSGADEGTGAKRSWRNVHLPESATRGVLAFMIEHLSPPDALPMANVTVPRDSAVEALDHVVVRSPAPDDTQAFYGKSLGLRLALDRSFEERKVRLQFFRVGGVTVEIASQLGVAPDPAKPDQLWGLAWRVPSADAARARLVEAGVPVTPVRTGNKPGTRVCTVESETCGVPTLLIGPD